MKINIKEYLLSFIVMYYWIKLVLPSNHISSFINVGNTVKETLDTGDTGPQGWLRVISII